MQKPDVHVPEVVECTLVCHCHSMVCPAVIVVMEVPLKESWNVIVPPPAPDQDDVDFGFGVGVFVAVLVNVKSSCWSPCS